MIFAYLSQEWKWYFRLGYCGYCKKSLSVYMYVHLYFSLYTSISKSRSLCLCNYVSISMTISIRITPFLSLRLCHYVYTSLILSLCPCLCPCLCLQSVYSLCLYASVSTFLSTSLSLRLCIYISVTMPLSLYLCVYVSVCTSQSLRLCLYVFVFTVCLCVYIMSLHLCLYVFVAVLFLFSDKMLCRTRPFLAIPTKIPCWCSIAGPPPPHCNSPAGAAIRHYFAEGSRSLSGPLYRLVLYQAAFSPFFFSLYGVYSVHHFGGETNNSISSSLWRE